MLKAVFEGRETEFTFESGGEMGVMFVADAEGDVLNGESGVEEVAGGERHTVVEDVAEDGSAEKCFEAFLKGAFVGADTEC